MKTSRTFTSAANVFLEKATLGKTTTRLVLGTVMLVLGAPMAIAGTIIVDSERDDDDSTSADGCTLRAAVKAANLDLPVEGCPAGSGFDTVIVVATPILSRDQPLDIQSEIEIQGGTRLTPIIGGASTFVVDKVASLIFNDIKLTGFTGTAITVQSGEDLANAFFASGYLELIHSEVSGNVGGNALAPSPSIANDGGVVGIFTTIIQDNIGGIAGGAIRNQGGGLYVTDSSLIANAALLQAGAIQNLGGGWVSLRNVTISGNQQTGADSAEGGGAIWNGPGSTIEIDFSTITANSATGPGGGIHNQGIMTIKRSILSGNGEDCRGRRIIASGGFNLVGDCPNLQITATDIAGEPLLASLTDGLQAGDLNGGQRYHVPLADSAAMNAIPASACEAPFYDQRWRSRPSQDACEIGAIETD